MRKISVKVYEQLKRSSKETILEALLPFVEKPRGRPKGNTPPLTPYQRLTRHRIRTKSSPSKSS